ENHRFGRISRHSLGHHVSSVYRGRSGQADAPFKCFALSDAQLDPFLGHDRFERLPAAEPAYRLERARSRTQGDPLSKVGKAAYLYFDPMGSLYSHGYGIPLRRPSRKALLAYRDHGRPLSCLGLLFGSGASHYAFIPGEEIL